ncbi:MAG: arginine N-succinyltransferase, partial [Archangium sp.]|nr:arginine N-succinyltransferase [Archangium sp.]
ATLFPEKVQKLIGEVGPETRGVQRMLERIGFKYVDHIDPFDGGPHYEANLDDVSLIRRFRTATLGDKHLEQEADECLVAVTRTTGANRFRAVRSQVRFDDQVVYIPRRARELLKVKAGDKLSIIPFE